MGDTLVEQRSLALHPPRRGDMTYSLGVDLGTSFVAAAVARPAGVAMVPLGDQSVVAPVARRVADALHGHSPVGRHGRT